MIAIPVDDQRRHHSKISETLSRAKYIMLATIDKTPDITDILDNPFFNLNQGAGPLFAYHLKVLKVETVITRQVGPSARRQLEDLGITVHVIPHIARVDDVLSLISDRGCEDNPQLTPADSPR